MYDGVLSSVLRQGITIVGVALSFSSVWLVAYLVTDMAAGVLSKVVQGVSFTSTATLVKMVLTFILLFNLWMNPKEIYSFVAQHAQVAAGLVDVPNGTYEGGLR